MLDNPGSTGMDDVALAAAKLLAGIGNEFGDSLRKQMLGDDTDRTARRLMGKEEDEFGKWPGMATVAPRYIPLVGMAVHPLMIPADIPGFQYTVCRGFDFEADVREDAADDTLVRVGSFATVRFVLREATHWAICVCMNKKSASARPNPLSAPVRCVRLYLASVSRPVGIEIFPYEDVILNAEHVAVKENTAAGWVAYANTLGQFFDPREEVVRDIFEPGWRKALEGKK